MSIFQSQIHLIFVYNIFIALYRLVIRISSGWNQKARQWAAGRKDLLQHLKENIPENEPTIWIHSSSAGEFEQAKPVIEALKQTHPRFKIIVSFFSPSGFKAAKNYTYADYITYLLLDTPKNAKEFLERVQPSLVLFIKYDFWYHHLKAVHERKIPLLLLSASFRPNQSFFKWYGGFNRKMLYFFDCLFVQDKKSFQLLTEIGIHNCKISGDTRFDRVSGIAANFTEVPFIKEFVGDSRVIVAGSTWKDDEEHLSLVAKTGQNLKLIIAPHEISADNNRRLTKLFEGSLLYSECGKDLASLPSYQTLIIDNVGMLSRLYCYAGITYVGGGFTSDGIHNILEAAVYGKPVLFGPNHKKYREAEELINAGGGFSFSKYSELEEKVSELLTDGAAYTNACSASWDYINKNRGATEVILNYIQEKRLLTI